MQAGHYSSLLPELFRHKTTRVRVFQPQAILLDFHGTISERRWEDKVIYPYVKRAVGEYLNENWSNEAVQRCIPGLRNESFEQRFRHKYEDAPIVDDQLPGEDLDPGHLATQLGDFLAWQMGTKRETKETQVIERLVWQDGFRRHKILLPLYDDVAACIKLWREQHNCSIYIISSIDNEGLKLLFENTEKGNLDQYISGYVSAIKMGDKLISDTYKRFYERLSPSKGASSHHPSIVVSPPTSTVPLVRPVLFLTDSGQEAKAASRVNDGNTFECILVNRPGNKRFRTYYLSQFQYVDNFKDIEFVPVTE